MKTDRKTRPVDLTMGVFAILALLAILVFKGDNLHYWQLKFFNLASMMHPSDDPIWLPAPDGNFSNIKGWCIVAFIVVCAAVVMFLRQHHRAKVTDECREIVRYIYHNRRGDDAFALERFDRLNDLVINLSIPVTEIGLESLDEYDELRAVALRSFCKHLDRQAFLRASTATLEKEKQIFLQKHFSEIDLPEKIKLALRTG